MSLDLRGGIKNFFTANTKERLQEKIKYGVIAGTELYLGGDYFPRFVNKHGYALVKKAKEFSPLVTKTGVGLAVGMVLPPQYEDSLISDAFDLMALDGIRDMIKFYVDKEPICVLTDANTLECKNFDDLANAEIFIDGTKKSSGADYTVSGTTVSLATALSSGEHTILVVDGTGKKAWKGTVVA